jgi:hypothetical protein
MSSKFKYLVMSGTPENSAVYAMGPPIEAMCETEEEAKAICAERKAADPSGTYTVQKVPAS